MQLMGTGSAFWSPRAFLRISGFSIALGSLENTLLSDPVFSTLFYNHYTIHAIRMLTWSCILSYMLTWMLAYNINVVYHDEMIDVMHYTITVIFK